MPERKRVDEEQNRPFPPGLSSSRNSNAFDALDEPIQNNVDEDEPRFCSDFFTSNDLDALEWRDPILEHVMEALADPSTHILGVCGSAYALKGTLLERVHRRIERGELFDRFLSVTVTKKPVFKKPDVRKLQKEIAGHLGLTFNHKSRSKRAIELIERIKTEQRILIVLRDIYKKLDLGKVGIPYGAEHPGCKILLTSTAEDVLSNHMHAQRTIRL